MPLPKINHPIHRIDIPSLGKKEQFRPFLVEEEKILLVANEDGTLTAIIDAMKQIVNNCALSKDFDVDELTLFDIEYIFLKIRAISVSNIAKVWVEDSEDKENRNFDIDLLKDVYIHNPDKLSEKIDINTNVGFVLKQPTIVTYTKVSEFESQLDVEIYLIASSIKSVYDNEEVYDAKEYTLNELMDFVKQLPKTIRTKCNDYFQTVPVMRCDIKYTNNMGNERKVTLSSVHDFFTLL